MLSHRVRLVLVMVSLVGLLLLLVLRAIDGTLDDGLEELLG